MSVPEKSLADQRVDKILAEIASLKQEVKTLSVKPQPPMREDDHEHRDVPKQPTKHFDSKDLETTCPECQKGIDAWKKSLTDPLEKQISELRSNLPYKCVGEGCDQHFSEKEARELSECPKCHAKGARRIS